MRIAIVFLTLFVSPVSAQVVLDGHGGGSGVSASPREIWEEFDRACSDVLTDPAGFVASHPTVGPDGFQLAHRSEDGQVLVLDHMSDKGVFRQMEIIGVPGELHILCQVSGGEEAMWSLEPARFAEFSEATHRDLIAVLAEDGIVAVGGKLPVRMPAMEAMAGDHVPDDLYTYILGFQAPIAGEIRFVYANLLGTNLSLTGHYVIRAEDAAVEAAEPAPVSGQTQTADAGSQAMDTPDGPAAAMRSVVELCLRNYRTPDAAPPALEAAGMTLSPAGDRTFEFSGPGVWGVVEAGDELYCTVQSPDVPLDAAADIGTDLATALFPGMVQPGAPEGGTGPCDGLSIFAPRQLIWLRYAQAGNSGECINDGTSAIIIN